jgi:hypothetical protein
MSRLNSIVRLARYATLLALALATNAALASSQEAERSGFFGFGLGLANGTMSVGGSTDSASGLIVSGQVGTASSGFRRWIVEVTAQGFEVPNPARAEAYRAVSFLVRRSLGSDVFVAPGLGVDYRSWSGPDPWEPSDIGLTLAVSLGIARRISDTLVLVPEIGFQTSSIELEGSVSGRLLSIRASLLRLRR